MHPRSSTVTCTRAPSTGAAPSLVGAAAAVATGDTAVAALADGAPVDTWVPDADGSGMVRVSSGGAMHRMAGAVGGPTEPSSATPTNAVGDKEAELTDELLLLHAPLAPRAPPMLADGEGLAPPSADDEAFGGWVRGGFFVVPNGNVSAV